VAAGGGVAPAGRSPGRRSRGGCWRPRRSPRQRHPVWLARRLGGAAGATRRAHAPLSSAQSPPPRHRVGRAPVGDRHRRAPQRQRPFCQSSAVGVGGARAAVWSTSSHQPGTSRRHFKSAANPTTGAAASRRGAAPQKWNTAGFSDCIRAFHSAGTRAVTALAPKADPPAPALLVLAATPPARRRRRPPPRCQGVCLASPHTMGSRWYACVCGAEPLLLWLLWPRPRDTAAAAAGRSVRGARRASVWGLTLPRPPSLLSSAP